MFGLREDEDFENNYFKSLDESQEEVKVPILEQKTNKTNEFGEITPEANIFDTKYEKQGKIKATVGIKDSC